MQTFPFTTAIPHQFNNFHEIPWSAPEIIKVERTNMSISARIRANRNNAKKSTGPRTDAGKAAVAQNARRHGLSGAFALLPHEDPAEFQDLLDDYRAEFKPASVDEDFLVEQMAQSRWTLARARRLEAHTLNCLAGIVPDRDDPDAIIARNLLNRNGGGPSGFQRYAAAAERSYYRARRELQQARSRELRNKANEAQAWLRNEVRETVPPDPIQPEPAALDDFNPDWPPVPSATVVDDPVASEPDAVLRR
jgi:hypothetical protein